MRRKTPRIDRHPLPEDAQVRTVHRADGTWAIYVKTGGQRLRFDSVAAYETWLRTIA